ncbi:MAG: hypothetical protein PT957_05205 [Firmicutes bacterium]|nr:hypothetical protein [Bacillota bacterium]
MGGDLNFFGKPPLSLVAKRSGGLAFFDKPPLFVGNKIGVVSYFSQKNNRQEKNSLTVVSFSIEARLASTLPLHPEFA